MKSRSILPGVLLIVLGVGFLGEIAGWWQINWQVVAALWPIYLIGLGIRLVLPRTVQFDWLFTVLLIVAVAALVSAPQRTIERLAGVQHENRTSSLSQTGASLTSNLSLEVQTDASTLRLAELPQDSDQLYTATSHGGQLNQTYRSDNGQAHARISQTGNWLSNTNDVTVAIARQPTLSLDVRGDASSLTIDTTNLSLSNLKLTGDASSATLKLGAGLARQTVTLTGDASHITIRVPQASGINLTTHADLGQNNFTAAGLQSTGEHQYASPNAATAPNQISIECNGDVSNFTIERY